MASFKALTDTGRVEIVGETYHHSLAFFYNQDEFNIQVDMHKTKIEQVFNQRPRVFRNTELAYNNDVAKWAEDHGYIGVLAEGWDKVLGWRNSNYMYRPVQPIILDYFSRIISSVMILPLGLAINNGANSR